MSRPPHEEPQYGQAGQTDSYYQDDYGQQQPHGYDQEYNQGDGYYEEQ